MTVGFGRSDDEAMSAGIERTAWASETITQPKITTREQTVSALCLHRDDISGRVLASADKTLSRVVDLWPSLPPDIKQAVYAMCVRVEMLRD